MEFCSRFFVFSVSLLAGVVCAARSEANPVNPLFWTDVVVTHNEASRCKTSEDPFAIPAFVYATPARQRPNGIDLRFPNTSNPTDNGRCVDQSHYRPALVLNDAGKAAYGWNAENGRIYIANVRSFDGFYTASIPLDSIKSLILQVAVGPMSVLGVRENHSQIRVQFAKAVVLTPQWPRSPNVRKEVFDLILSANPTGVTEAARQDPVRGVDGSLLQARGVYTLDVRLFDAMITAKDHTIEQFRLRASADEAASFVKRFFTEANRRRLTQQFILTGLNCTSTIFEVLNKSMGHRFTSRTAPFDPKHIVGEFEARDLIDTQLSPMEEESWAKIFLSQY